MPWGVEASFKIVQFGKPALQIKLKVGCSSGLLKVGLADGALVVGRREVGAGAGGLVGAATGGEVGVTIGAPLLFLLAFTPNPMDRPSTTSTTRTNISHIR